MRGAQAALLDPAINLQRGLTSYWAFEDGSGSTVADSMGTNPGTWQGTLGSQWTTGILGGGGHFNATDNYVSLPNATSLNPGTAITVSAWLFPTGSLSASRGLFVKDVSGAITQPPWGLEMGSPGIFFRITNASNVAVNTAIVALTASQWTHVVGTYDGTTLRLYLNGTLVATAAQTGLIATTTGAAYLGQQKNGASRFFSGNADEFGLWGRAVSPQEARALYNAGTGRRPV